MAYLRKVVTFISRGEEASALIGGWGLAGVVISTEPVATLQSFTHDVALSKV